MSKDGNDSIHRKLWACNAIICINSRIDFVSICDKIWNKKIELQGELSYRKSGVWEGRRYQQKQIIGTEEFEDTKGVIRIRKSKKNRQHIGQKK